MTFDPHFKVTKLFEVEYRKNAKRLEIETKLKTKLLLHNNRKLYLTYGMVLCLVTLTHLQTRRAGLSASAEVLVCWHSGRVALPIVSELGVTLYPLPE